MYYLKKIILQSDSGILGTVILKNSGDKLSVQVKGIQKGDRLLLCDKERMEKYPLPIQTELVTTLFGEIECGILQNDKLIACGSTRVDNKTFYLKTFLQPKKEVKPTPPAPKIPIENQPKPETEVEKEKQEIKTEVKKEIPKQEDELMDFYLSVKKNLDEMFLCYPEENALTRIIPNSKWISVSRSDGRYVVGLIYEKSQPRYICYGMPGDKSMTPPNDLKKYCQYLPVDEEKGYWIVFQDAKTGETLQE